MQGPLMALNPGPAWVTGSLTMLVVAAASVLSSEASSLAYFAWTWGARIVIAVVALTLAWRVTLDGVFRGAMVITFLTLAVATGWVLPWYGLWLVPWILTETSPRLRLAVVAYTAALPVLYTPDAIERATVVVTLAVHLVPLGLAWSWWRAEYAGCPKSKLTPIGR